MTMVSIPAAMTLAPGSSSTSQSPALTPPPASAFEPVPPTLDAALAAGFMGSLDVLRCARLSLLHSLPRVGIAWSLWCGHCGALREVGDDTVMVAKPSRKRDSEGFLKAEAEDELEAELNAQFAALEEEEEKARPARRPQRRRRAPHCALCGTKFQRPRPIPPPYPAARAARTRRQSALAADAQAQAKEAALSPAGTLDAGQLLGAAQAPVPVQAQAQAKPAPGLKNVASGSPTASYPQPKSAPPPQPNGGIVTTLPTSPPPAKKRKVKKSGLKQLLAQNAAREIQKGSGNWGLG
ncbi:hypothetical protein CC85DRAFT_325148 [Cutaneotrichosporon oleaginosum]|uniref:Uncharacterized protein n=1 Tax=Cutaneotrichosporon oleaginosum TaxID=879819 RepID=A0A0J0XXR6_9TREE|nr:uncharacterized protein CC85DRAFT_325148 [Cutaneotrichosporon oleaginosum]KLT45867.1 hypothetical protein CC85DRAFT_325148 [Cutaneotrichosporon oleaginosum]TXT06569.1 hypothetical protein COLE_05900 [Cutaneotrichosporon oleaginosum]